ncbi:carbonic anhydrase [Coniophora puteana RWD-64-598 SS2]|uniref:Carbonic anhydrase n=1 Tax=Coniophora puteana (strain RWD-64-598) TaxID=741705 RepID=A0A5M3N4Y1_CONPW|nr:carbonic anhydrase [Coniophora puteana RWD-64-598 SS2]EIW86469.1 carbonic anhydrase [Coniophora puteana RWD-64-598 SS2]
MAEINFIQNNEQYASNFGDRGKLALPPSKKLIVVTCMDARINPAEALGIKDGEAHVIRNAGGLTKEAVRSVVISQRLLGTKDILVIQHTDCGMLTFTDPSLREQITQAHSGNDGVTNAVKNFEFGPFDDLDQSIKNNVQFLKEDPLVLTGGSITGYAYAVETGKLRRVA